MKNCIHKYGGWFLSGILAILFVNQKIETNCQRKRVDTLSTVLTARIPAILQETKAIKDSSQARENRQTEYRNVERLNVDTTSNVIKSVDTVNIYLRKVIANNESAIVKKNDSLNIYRQQNVALLAYNKQLIEAHNNVVFYSSKPTTIDSVNASIYAEPFKKSSNQSFFSPQKNYLRIYNQNGGTVNNLPYFDYEQTNDEINQLLFQIRASQNIGSGVFNFGAGVELKLNRTGINAAGLFNPFVHRPFSFSIGLRQDIYRIRFK